MKCVQNQLAALGYDPGPVDGAMGPRTRKAATRRLEKGTFLSPYEPQPLTRKTAFQWCRILAHTHPLNAKEFIPASKGPNIYADDPRMEEATLKAFNKMVRFMRSAYGVVLIAETDIIISVRPSQIVARANKAMGKRRFRLSNRQAAEQRARCNKTKRIVASAFPRVITICVGVDLYKNSADAPKDLERVLWPAMMHELFHKAQNELSGSEEVLTQRKIIEQKGPRWLVEGCAVYFEERLIERETLLFKEKRIFPYTTQRIVQRALSSPQKLNEIATRRGFQKSEKPYQVGHLACHLLGEKYGPLPIINLWRRTGRGETMEEAFKAEFGIEMDAFAKDFDERRFSIGRVFEYLNAP